MVWKAIAYGRPAAGSLEAKIPAGSWVVIKPNIVFLKPQPGYRSGDVTDPRVTRAVLEYVARFSRAGRVTVAEGGSYRSGKDPNTKDAVQQDGRRVGALDYDWGREEFAGWGGTLGGMLGELGREFPDKRFDYVDLSYDAVRDASGGFRRIEVPRAANGVGAFGARPDYFVTNTIRNCDFLIDVPVMKVHLDCGITACLKNFVGTAPREAYAPPQGFWNARLHSQHSFEGRIDPFIVDLASFHPPDFNVVDGIRGLQFKEHNAGRDDQTLRNNMVLAGEDTVAVDSLVAHLMGFQPADIDFLHMAAARGIGSMDLSGCEVNGDDPEDARERWGKPANWFGRCNRQWLVTAQPGAPMAAWKAVSTRADTLNFERETGAPAAPGKTYAAAATLRAEGARKGFLWLGVSGRATVRLNGEEVTVRENRTRYRVGQFRTPIELASGKNLLEVRVTALNDAPKVSLLLTGSRNDGDTLSGVKL